MSKCKEKATKVTEALAKKHKQGRCAFCHQGRETADLLKSGDFYSMNNNNNKYFHYFCVLFSRDGVQNGEDDQGLLGFFSKDIELELKRTRNVKCAFCQKKNASAVCRSKKCHLNFHFPCGYQNGVVFVFNDRMESFCSKHQPKQNSNMKSRRLVVKDDICLAGCSETILKTERFLVSPCCGRKYHVNCLQQMSLQSGRAHYKCPVCSSKSEFLDESIRMGIYVPEKDASWEDVELEDFYNFTAMGRLHQTCDADSCVCPKGREHHMTGTDYEIIRCHLCGMKGTHIKCGKLDKFRPDFTCEDHNLVSSESEGDEQESAECSQVTRRLSELSSESSSSSAPPSPRQPAVKRMRRVRLNRRNLKTSVSASKKCKNKKVLASPPPSSNSTSPPSSDTESESSIDDAIVEAKLNSSLEEIQHQGSISSDPHSEEVTEASIDDEDHFVNVSEELEAKVSKQDDDDDDDDITIVEEVNLSKVSAVHSCSGNFNLNPAMIKAELDKSTNSRNHSNANVCWPPSTSVAQKPFTDNGIGSMKFHIPSSVSRLSSKPGTTLISSSNPVNSTFTAAESSSSNSRWANPAYNVFQIRSLESSKNMKDPVTITSISKKTIEFCNPWSPASSTATSSVLSNNVKCQFLKLETSGQNPLNVRSGEAKPDRSDRNPMDDVSVISSSNARLLDHRHILQKSPANNALPQDGSSTSQQRAKQQQSKSSSEIKIISKKITNPNSKNVQNTIIKEEYKTALQSNNTNLFKVDSNLLERHTASNLVIKKPEEKEKFSVQAEIIMIDDSDVDDDDVIEIQ